MDEYIEKNKIINLLEYNNKVYHYADRDKENIVHDTVQTLCQVMIEAKAADVQPVKREKWKEILEILRDAVEELEYYETHGDILDRHIWKYKNEALALIGEDGEDNESK